MTSITDKLQAIDDFREWREERTLAGIDVSVEAYEAHLEDRQNAEIVSRLRAIIAWTERCAGDDATTSDSDAIERIADVLTETAREVEE